MRIGCPKEIKAQEFRVGLLPGAVRELVAHGHRVLVEAGAGMGADCSDRDYRDAGADVIVSAEEVYRRSELIVKVKEPQANERAWLREDQVLFTYLHLAADPEQTQDLLASGVTAFAYETVTDRDGGLPLLAPMSEVAGKLAPQVGAWALQRANGGRGVLPGGVAGVAPARVVVIGGGTVGQQAARVAAGMGADVVVLDRSLARLRLLDTVDGGRYRTAWSGSGDLLSWLTEADLIIAAALQPGARAPLLLRRDDLASLRRGAVLVDVAIDQGGCFETSRPTTHENPIYQVDGVVHYCVANMPGAVPRTSARALGNATLPMVLALADQGWKDACRADRHLLAGLTLSAGRLFCEPVAEALGLAASPAEDLLGG